MVKIARNKEYIPLFKIQETSREMSRVISVREKSRTLLQLAAPARAARHVQVNIQKKGSYIRENYISSIKSKTFEQTMQILWNKGRRQEQKRKPKHD